MAPNIESPLSQLLDDDDDDAYDTQELLDQIKFIDETIKEYDDAIKGHKEQRRDLMAKFRSVTMQFTKDQIVDLTESKSVTLIENFEVVIYDAHVHFESYYHVPQFKILLTAKIPVGHAFLRDRDIPPSNKPRNWMLLKDFVTYELFDL